MSESETDTLRLIKKYPNRRLYDTEVSRYITLQDIKLLVLKKVSFQVIEARSKQDITRNILLQIISEQEESDSPIFTNEVLCNIIRLYGDSFQGVLRAYLDNSLTIFSEQHRLIRRQMNSLLPPNPLATLTELAERNISGLWRAMQEHMPIRGQRSHDEEADEATPPSANPKPTTKKSSKS